VTGAGYQAGMRGATLTYFGERVGGDQIVEIDGGAVRTVNDVLRTLDQHAPGDQVSVPTMRCRNGHNLGPTRRTVTLAAR
jgi:S1-C subfamily serine protease